MIIWTQLLQERPRKKVVLRRSIASQLNLGEISESKVHVDLARQRKYTVIPPIFGAVPGQLLPSPGPRLFTHKQRELARKPSPSARAQAPAPTKQRECHRARTFSAGGFSPATRARLFTRTARVHRCASTFSCSSSSTNRTAGVSPLHRRVFRPATLEQGCSHVRTARVHRRVPTFSCSSSSIHQTAVVSPLCPRLQTSPTHTLEQRFFTRTARVHRRAPTFSSSQPRRRSHPQPAAQAETRSTSAVSSRKQELVASQGSQSQQTLEEFTDTDKP